MNCIKLLLTGIILIVAVLIVPKTTYASEGTIELRSTTGESYRCYAASIQMIDLNYTIPITCRDLLYPAGEDIFTYLVWATPINGGKPIKLGALGLGRATFKTKAKFSSLFVTTEKNSKTKTPSGTIVMRGDVKKITFLEGSKTPGLEEESVFEKEATPSPTPSTRERLVAGLKRAAVVSVLALGALIGLVFVLTRKR